MEVENQVEKQANETEVYLIRHAVTAWNQSGHYQGSSDIPLNEDGHKQAEALKNRFVDAGTKVDKIYTSKLVRTQETAAPLAEAYGIEPIVIEGLEEIHGGEMEGKHHTELDEQYAEMRQVARTTPYFIETPGGETGKEVFDRAVVAFKQAVEESRGQSIVLVSHGYLLQLLVKHLKNENPEEAESLIAANTAITRVLVDEDDNIKLIYLNDSSHLV